MLTEFKTRREAFVSHLHVVITIMKLLRTEEVSGTLISVHHTILSVILIYCLFIRLTAEFTFDIV